MTKSLFERLPRQRTKGRTPETMRTEDMRCRVTPALGVAVRGVSRQYREQGVQYSADVMTLALEEMIFQMTSQDPALAKEVTRALRAEGLPTDYDWLAASKANDHD